MSNSSFAAVGNELLHQMRDRINNSEDRTDLETNFSFTMKKLFDSVLDGSQLIVNDDAITFQPEAKGYYQVNKDLMNIMEFKSLWNNSDISNVISKFALATYKRYKHLSKHPEKTNRKIRN